MGLRPARTTNWAPAALTVLGLVLLGLLFVPECDDCYFVYWSFDSLRDWLLTRPSTAGAEIVGVPENGRYLGNFLGVLQGKLYFVPWVGPILRGVLMGGAMSALVFLLARRAQSAAVGLGEALAAALALVLLAPRGIWQEGFSWGAGLVNYLLPLLLLLTLVELLARREPPHWLLVGVLAFLGCLFMETMTILLAAAGACTGLLLVRSPRRRQGLAVWLGSWLGAVVMFTASGYRNGTNADRRVDLSMVLDHLKTVVTEAVVFPAAAAVLISVLLVWLVRARRGRWKVLAGVLVPLHLVQLWLAAENWLGEPRYDAGWWWGSAWPWRRCGAFLLAQKGGERPHLGGGAGSWACCAGPLLFVTPIGGAEFPAGVRACWSWWRCSSTGEARAEGLGGRHRAGGPPVSGPGPGGGWWGSMAATVWPTTSGWTYARGTGGGRGGVHHPPPSPLLPLGHQ